MLLRALFDLDSVEKLNAYNKQRDLACAKFEAAWHNPLFEEEEAHWALSERLSSLFCENERVEISPTKAALVQHVRWGSSKFNALKKGELIELIIKSLRRDHLSYTVREFTTGAYGAGATGNGRSNYDVRSRGGDYALITYGLNTYLFDGVTVFDFSSNERFEPKRSLSDACINHQTKRALAAKRLEQEWPVKNVDSDF